MKKFVLALSLVLSATTASHADTIEPGFMFTKSITGNIKDFSNITTSSLKSFVAKSQISKEQVVKTLGKAPVSKSSDGAESWFYGIKVNNKNSVQQCYIAFSFETGSNNVDVIDMSSETCEKLAS